MITNQTHTHTNPPPPPLGEPESKKIGFSAVRPLFCKFRDQQNHTYVSIKTWYNQCHNKMKMKWYKY